MTGFGPPAQIFAIPDSTRDIAPEVLDANGRMRILPAAYWATTTRAERGLFGSKNGIYCFPTVELVDLLGEMIAGRSAIEIGSGNGVLAAELGIPATDNCMQDKTPYREYLTEHGVAPVPYGPNVTEYHASAAVRAYRPDVVIGCWVTHRYDRNRHWAGGNIIGVDEADILRNCKTFILVGNEEVHADSTLWQRPHEIVYPEFVFSRSMNGSRDFIATWKGAKQ